jgi:phage-related protein
MRKTRPISWLKGALRDYRDFPKSAQTIAEDALNQIAEGGTPDVPSP